RRTVAVLPARVLAAAQGGGALRLSGRRGRERLRRGRGRLQGRGRLRGQLVELRQLLLGELRRGPVRAGVEGDAQGDPGAVLLGGGDEGPLPGRGLAGQRRPGQRGDQQGQCGEPCEEGRLLPRVIVQFTFSCSRSARRSRADDARC